MNRGSNVVPPPGKSFYRGGKGTDLDTLGTTRPRPHDRPRFRTSEGAQIGVSDRVAPTRGEPPPATTTAQQKYQNRARSKFLTRRLSTVLCEHAKGQDERASLERSYRRSIYCGEAIVQRGENMTSRYCGNRWCLVCGRIRTAKAVNCYGPEVESWGSPHLVTLTIRNMPGDELPGAIDRMIRTASNIQRAVKRQFGFLRGVRKIECTYNPHTNDYHPHFHFIVDGALEAEAFCTRWLKAWRGQAEPGGQDVRRADGHAIAELCKYFSKIVVKSHEGERRAAPVHALDTIFRAMKSRRVYQPFGFTISGTVEGEIESEEVRGEAWKRVEESIVWAWNQDVADWIDERSGEVLTGYVPGEKYRKFVEGIGDDGGLVNKAESPCYIRHGDNNDGTRTPDLARAQEDFSGLTLSVLRGAGSNAHRSTTTLGSLVWDGKTVTVVSTTTGRNGTVAGYVQSTSDVTRTLSPPLKCSLRRIENNGTNNGEPIGKCSLSSIESKQWQINRWKVPMGYLVPSSLLRDTTSTKGNGERADEGKEQGHQLCATGEAGEQGQPDIGRSSRAQKGIRAPVLGVVG